MSCNVKMFKDTGRIPDHHQMKFTHKTGQAAVDWKEYQTEAGLRSHKTIRKATLTVQSPVKMGVEDSRV
jgi:hypothetical protein